MTELERLEARIAKLKAEREAKVKDLEDKVEYYAQHESAALDKISALPNWACYAIMAAALAGMAADAWIALRARERAAG